MIKQVADIIKRKGSGILTQEDILEFFRMRKTIAELDDLYDKASFGGN